MSHPAHTDPKDDICPCEEDQITALRADRDRLAEALRGMCNFLEAPVNTGLNGESGFLVFLKIKKDARAALAAVEGK